MMHLDPRNIEVMDDAMAAVYRDKTVAERLKIANQMFLFARGMIRSQVTVQYPQWTDAQILRETARRISNGPG